MITLTVQQTRSLKRQILSMQFAIQSMQHFNILFTLVHNHLLHTKIMFLILSHRKSIFLFLLLLLLENIVYKLRFFGSFFRFHWTIRTYCAFTSTLFCSHDFLTSFTFTKYNIFSRSLAHTLNIQCFDWPNLKLIPLFKI